MEQLNVWLIVVAVISLLLNAWLGASAANTHDEKAWRNEVTRELKRLSIKVEVMSTRLHYLELTHEYGSKDPSGAREESNTIPGG